MKIMARKKRNDLAEFSKAINLDTAALVRKKLAELSPKNAVVLGTVKSSKEGRPPYKISLSAGNTVSCGCNGFKYRNTCRHMDEFRLKHKPVAL